MSKIAIGGLLETSGLVLLKVMGVHSGPGVAGLILSTLGQHGINVLCVVSSMDSAGRENMSLAVGHADLDQALGLLQTIKEEIDAAVIECQKNVCVMSIYSPHFSDRPTIAGMMFQAMSEGGIDIQAISTSVSTVSCVIAEKDLETAREKLAGYFLIP